MAFDALDLLLEVFDDPLLITVDPAGQAKEKELNMAQPGRVGAGDLARNSAAVAHKPAKDTQILVESERKRVFLDSTGD